MLKKAIVGISVVTSLLLAQNTTHKDILTSYQTFTFEKNTKSEYNQVCRNVCYSLKIALMQICEITEPDKEIKAILNDFLILIKESKEIAESRIKKHNSQWDKNVLYSLLSAEHIIEAALDDEFLELTQGYKMPDDILAFGRGLYGIS